MEFRGETKAAVRFPFNDLLNEIFHDDFGDVDIMNLKMINRCIKDFYNSFTGRLANKLILIFSLIVSVFIIALVMLSYFRTIDISTSDFIDKNKSVLELVGQSFDNYIQQIDGLSLSLRKDEGEQLISILAGDNNDYQSDRYIENQVQNLFNSRQDIAEVSLYIPSSGKDFYISRTYANVRIRQAINLQNAEWYKNAIMGRYFRYVEPGSVKSDDITQSGNNEVFFTFHRALININNQKPLAVVSISFDYSMIKRNIWSENSPEGEVLSIYDKDDKLFYCSDSNLENADGLNSLLAGTTQDSASGSFRTKINNKEYLVVYNVSEAFGWKTAKLIPIDALNQRSRQNRNISLMLGIAFILILITLIIFVSNIITGSLNRLHRQMDKVGKGDFKIKAEIHGNDEIAHLAQKFNFMVEQIYELVNEKYIAKINEKTAQLKALEAQIDPHFLYNSLQAISSKAVLNGNKDISRMIEALANSFRYCIKGGDMVRISDEMEHINNYLILHKARFEDRLFIEVTVEDGTQDTMIPKLSVHTLVENSIKHCIEHVTRFVTIKIHTYIDNGRTIIQVSDNGPGIAQEQLQELKNELNSSKMIEESNEKIGLKNLNARLKLMYDNDASLEIVSCLNQGTEIRIILPMKGRGDAENVQSTDNR